VAPSAVLPLHDMLLTLWVHTHTHSQSCEVSQEHTASIFRAEDERDGAVVSDCDGPLDCCIRLRPVRPAEEHQKIPHLLRRNPSLRGGNVAGSLCSNEANCTASDQQHCSISLHNVRWSILRLRAAPPYFEN
jgi:hypothetical protein